MGNMSGTAKALAIFAAVVIALFAVGFSASSLFTANANIINIEPAGERPEYPLEMEGFEIYSGPDFYVSYPEDWRPNKISNEFADIEIGFISPPQFEGDTIIESVLIASDQMGSLTLNDYTTVSLLRLQTEVIPGFSIVDAGPRKVGNIDGFETIFTGNDGINPTVKYMQVYVPKDGKMFVISYFSNEENFDSFEAESNEIVNSFQPF